MSVTPVVAADGDGIELQPNNSMFLDELIDLALTLAERERQALIEGTVKSWAAEERKGLSKEMSALLSKRAVVIQSDALARHEKGEDVTSAAELLQVIVDMTVQVQLLVKRASESA